MMRPWVAARWCVRAPTACTPVTAMAARRPITIRATSPPIRLAPKNPFATSPSSGGTTTAMASDVAGPTTQPAAAGVGGNELPHFGNIAANMDAPADLGAIDTSPATGVKLSQTFGPWVVMAGSTLMGELFIDGDGFAFYRPGSGLGHGVGKVVLTDVAAGFTTFSCELEVYVYDNASRNPPALPETYVITGGLAEATAKQHNYSTLTLAGHLHKKDRTTKELTFVGKLNAAKMTPYDVSSYTPFRPNDQLQQAFEAIFPKKLQLSRNSNSAGAPLNLAEWKLGNVPHVYYVPDYITREEEQECMAHLDRTPKELRSQLEKRVVQEYGGTMCEQCKQSFVPDANLPPWTNVVCDTLARDGVFDVTTYPNNVRIHEYEVGQGIAPHCDGPIYVPIVAIVSLQSPVLMSFYPRQEPHEDVMRHYNDTFQFDGPIAKQAPAFSLILEPRSLLVFTDDVYFYHPHGISDQAEDSLETCGPILNRHLVTGVPPNATSLQRKRRVGITVRNLLPRCNHQPLRAEFFLKRAWQTKHQALLGAPTGGGIPRPAEAQGASASPTRPVSSGAASASNYAGMSKPPPADRRHDASSAGSFDRSSAITDLSARLAKLEAKQDDILLALREIQVVLAHGAQNDAAFRQDVGAILDNLTTSVMDLSASLPPRS